MKNLPNIVRGMTPRIPLPKNLSTLAIVELYSIPEPNSGCLLWLGSLNKVDGYPTMRRSGRYNSEYVHRVVWSYFNGVIPKGHDIHERCQNRLCVNILHLSCITHKRNTQLRRVQAGANHRYEKPENMWRE